MAWKDNPLNAIPARERCAWCGRTIHNTPGLRLVRQAQMDVYYCKDNSNGCNRPSVNRG